MLTGTNKDYIDTKIPHLSTLLSDNIDKVIKECDVIIVNNKESEFIDKVSKIDDKVIIDFARLNDDLLDKENYIGINW